MMSVSLAHTPVMLSEVIKAINPRDGGVYVDGTFGNGGHALGLLEAADCFVWGIDRDPEAVFRGRNIARTTKGRLRVVQGRFGDMCAILEKFGIKRVNGIVLDLGVSSMQLDTLQRGFSFHSHDALDMRMEQQGRSASEVVNSMPEGQLADIIYQFGNERAAYRIARAIVREREKRPFKTCAQLAAIVRAAVCSRGVRPVDKKDAATRTFQAIRIYVNDELEELKRGLECSRLLLDSYGRLVVISFHSLEDRLVKSFLRQHAGKSGLSSRHYPEQRPSFPSVFRLLHKRPQKPSGSEIKSNPRARSARLRSAEKTKEGFCAGEKGKKK